MRRAQVSLQIDDEVLYENLIRPYKERKALNGLIVRCLAAYYYDETLRAAIEGVEDTEQDSEDVKTVSQLFNDIRTGLLMQGVYLNELQNTVDDGTDVLKSVNSAMYGDGVAEPDKSEYGAGVPQSRLAIVEKAPTSESSAEHGSSGVGMEVVNRLIEAVSIIARSSGNMEALTVLGVAPASVQREVGTDDVIPAVDGSSDAAVAVAVEHEQMEPAPVEDSPYEMDVIEAIDNDVAEEDASDAMDALLDGLL